MHSGIFDGGMSITSTTIIVWRPEGLCICHGHDEPCELRFKISNHDFSMPNSRVFSSLPFSSAISKFGQDGRII